MKAYTYLIGWSSFGKFYYGVRFAKGCSPDELWVSYFTSSKHVKRFAKLNGPPDIVQIRRTFDSIDAARAFESKVLKRIRKIDESKWLNKTDNISIPSGRANTKGKTYEEIYGPEKAAILRELRRITFGKSSTGRKHSEETKAKMSKSRTGLTSNKRGKTYEELYGEEKASAIKEKLCLAERSPYKIIGKTYEEIYGEEKANIRKEKLKYQSKEKIRNSLGRWFSQEAS